MNKILIIPVLLSFVYILKYILPKFTQIKVGETINLSFPFKDNCYALGGVLNENLNNDNNPDYLYTGSLLECTKPAEYGHPLVELSSEIQNIINDIKDKKINITTEEEKLRLYYKIVYPQSSQSSHLSFEELKREWNSFELHYILPPEIMPQTPIVKRRVKDFYQTPKGVVLEQIPNRKAEKGPYVEVYHNGSNASFLRPYKTFGSTWYYPVKGSGIWIPTQNMLTARNKIHALKLLDVNNTDILKHGGNDFVRFVMKDSLKSGEKLLQIEVYDKQSGRSFENGDYNSTKSIMYSEKALANIIDDIASGANIRKDYRIDPTTGKIVLMDIYYGGSDTVDNMLAQIARNRGYNNIQLLQEPQLSGNTGIINVGTEIMNLYEPIASQQLWLKLDPSKRYEYDYPIIDFSRYNNEHYKK